MSGRVRQVLVAVACWALLANAGLSRASDDPSMEPRTHVGDRMPAFTVQTLAGPAFSLSAIKGKVVVVNFWATWCGPCEVEMPALEKEVWEKHKASSDFAMIAIAREQTRETVTGFQAQHGEYTFPLAFDPQRTTYKLFADAGIPRTYVVNRQGIIVFQSMGADPNEFAQMERALDRALQGNWR